MFMQLKKRAPARHMTAGAHAITQMLKLRLLRGLARGLGGLTRGLRLLPCVTLRRLAGLRGSFGLCNLFRLCSLFSLGARLGRGFYFGLLLRLCRFLGGRRRACGFRRVTCFGLRALRRLLRRFEIGRAHV